MAEGMASRRRQAARRQGNTEQRQQTVGSGRKYSIGRLGGGYGDGRVGGGRYAACVRSSAAARRRFTGLTDPSDSHLDSEEIRSWEA